MTPDEQCSVRSRLGGAAVLHNAPRLLYSPLTFVSAPSQGHTAALIALVVLL